LLNETEHLFIFYVFIGNVGNVTVLQRPQIMVNDPHNSGISSSAAGYADSRASANSFFPDWEHAHPLHDRLIKKTEVSASCDVLQNFQLSSFSVFTA